MSRGSKAGWWRHAWPWALVVVAGCWGEDDGGAPGYADQCADRTDTWMAVWESEHGDYPGGAGGGLPIPADCPDKTRVSIVVLSDLGLQGEYAVSGPTHDAATGRCCYTTGTAYE